jgi:hypothetical protein
MHPIIAKTFGGLSASYLLRQFIFGLIFPVAIFSILNDGKHPLQLSMIVMLVVNTLLYPYSRFVYESVMNFIVGDNVFFVNAILLLAFKFMTMMLCWTLAVFIAPLGLAYLYFYHSKSDRT